MIKMIIVIEVKSYLQKLSKIIHKGQKESELREDVKNFIGADPFAGNIITGTGGLRKIRYPIPGKGKSGGYRIIYYFYNENNPLYLLTLYTKSEKDNLDPQEKKAMSKIIAELKKNYK